MFFVGFIANQDGFTASDAFENRQSHAAFIGFREGRQQWHFGSSALTHRYLSGRLRVQAGAKANGALSKGRNVR
jgi:hypothetical protein